MPGKEEQELLLLLDTCGERASVAICRGAEVLAERELAERTASAGLLGGIRELLASANELPDALTGIGVVNGPGSFTGLRVGLAVAKGFSEAMQLPLAAVSRLAVLAEAGDLREGFCALRAGRDEVYVRDALQGTEALMRVDGLADLAEEHVVLIAEEALRPVLESVGIKTRVAELRAAHALFLVQASLAAGGVDGAQVDANYVRDEDTIYARARNSS